MLPGKIRAAFKDTVLTTLSDVLLCILSEILRYVANCMVSVHIDPAYSRIQWVTALRSFLLFAALSAVFCMSFLNAS